ncbi:hypothetical protein PVL29_016098 [Vitis rotundifolia]|uniref:Uncharacterized protein n=1 Tax=Vitis rotundifolia TaxID=103349 RepID=A0AA39DL27_VITRO|nr:hypothetical protein PVL29_016098 [Vitis rotundifolia]
MLILNRLALAKPVEMENMVVRCGEEVSELLDPFAETGIEEIKASNIDKLQARKAVMSRMLVKSLQAGDAVFERISHAVYLAARGVVLAGNAVDLTDRVVEAAEILVAAATVSANVHGQWYTYLTDNM